MERFSTAIIVICFAISLRAQSASRLWTVQLPPTAAYLTYSDDCTRYAYKMNDSLVVRGNAVSGFPRDTVSVHTSSGIVYVGNRLYMLMPGDGDTTVIGYVESGSQSIVVTPLKYCGKETIGEEMIERKNFALQQNPGTSTFLVYCGKSIVRTPGISHVIGRITGEMYVVRVPSHSQYSLPIRCGSISRSADDQYCVVSTSASYFSFVPHNDERSDSYGWRVIRMGENPDFGPNVVWDTDKPGVLATGWLPLYSYYNYLYNVGLSSFTTLPSNAPRPIVNLDRGVMLSHVNDSTETTLVAYHVASLTSTKLDVLPYTSTNFSAYARSVHRTLFVLDSVSMTLRRYGLSIAPQADTAVFVRSADRCAVWKNVVCKCEMYSNVPVGTYRWYVGDSLVAVTDTAIMVYRAGLIGIYDMRVDIYDTNGIKILEAAAKTPLTVYRPDALMIFRSGLQPVRSIDISPDGVRLVLGRHDTISVYSLPEPFTDYSHRVIHHRPLEAAVGFAGSNDSILTVRYHPLLGPDYGAFERAEMTAIGLDTGRLVYTIKRGHLPNSEVDQFGSPMMIYGKLLYNPEGNQYFSFSKVSSQKDLTGLHSDGIYHIPLRSEQIGYIPKKHSKGVDIIYDADASYGRTMVIATKYGVEIGDIDSQLIVQSFGNEANTKIRSAILKDDSTLLTTRGVYTYASSWKRLWPVPFEDGGLVMRLPSRDAYIVIRSNADTLGHIVSALDGSILHTWLHDFDFPLCAVYDTKHGAVHVGHAAGIVSSWHVPASFTVSVDGRALLPHEAVSPLAFQHVSVYDIHGQHVEDVIADEYGSFDLAMQGFPSGLYIVIWRGLNGMASKLVLH